MTDRAARRWVRGPATAALVLLTGCGGLQVRLHKATSAKPSNVALYYSVETYDGRPVPDLSADSFRIYEDGRLISPYESKQTILNPEVAVIHYTLLLLDLSGSIIESGSIPTIQDAAQAFADRVTRLHPMAVYGFDGSKDLRKIVSFTTRSNTVQTGLAFLPHVQSKDPSTNLNGSVVEALGVLDKELKRTKQPLKFATLVVFTDGTDRAHRVTEDAMLDAIDASQANVFVIGVGAEIDAVALEQMARTGFVKTDALTNIGSAFDQVAEFIEASARKFYLLSYCSPARAGVHELTVEVTGAAGATGTLSHTFDANGFKPKCNPNRPPKFDTGRIRLPSRP